MRRTTLHYSDRFGKEDRDYASEEKNNRNSTYPARTETDKTVMKDTLRGGRVVSFLSLAY
jgi:hypothetical protein